ncbi:MAG: hypothetical protein V4651_09200 [Bacteroidota bacterium]
MKNIILILLVAFLASCKKEAPEDIVNILPAQPVYFTVGAHDTLPKSIHLEMWSVKQGTKEKGELIAQIDTTISIHEKTTFTLWQNVKPVIYCIATLSVKTKAGSDIINLEISSKSGMCVRRATGCFTDQYAIDNQYISLY